MKASPFRYHLPSTIDEAVATLAEVAPLDGRVLAGGQSLVPIMAFRLSRPAPLTRLRPLVYNGMVPDRDKRGVALAIPGLRRSCRKG